MTIMENNESVEINEGSGVEDTNNDTIESVTTTTTTKSTHDVPTDVPCKHQYMLMMISSLF